MARAIARPRPAPGRPPLGSSRTNRSKIRSRSAGGTPGPVVHHANEGLGRRTLERHADAAVRRRCSRRVVEQVPQHSGQGARIAAHRRGRAGRHVHLDAADGRRGLVERGPRHQAQVDVGGDARRRAVEPGEIEQVGDQPAEARGVAGESGLEGVPVRPGGLLA